MSEVWYDKPRPENYNQFCKQKDGWKELQGQIPDERKEKFLPLFTLYYWDEPLSSKYYKIEGTVRGEKVVMVYSRRKLETEGDR